MDGPLHAIQAAHQEFADVGVGYLLRLAATEGVEHARRTWTQLYSPMLRANEQGVERVTEAVFEIADFTGVLGVNPSAEDPMIDAQSRSHALSAPQRFALRCFQEMFRLWQDSEVSGSNVMVAFDQSFELFLRSILRISPSKRICHPELLKRAERAAILSGRERYRLSLFHKTRNRCQHQGCPARSETVNSFAEFGRNLFRRLRVDNY